MCRWLAYSGPALRLDAILFKPENSLIQQSLRAQRSRSVTNGDGFGVGWYSDHPHPGVFRDIHPAWNDENLRNLAEQIREFEKIRRELAFTVRPYLFASMKGATDSETFFYLAIGEGLEDDPPGALSRAINIVEAVRTKAGISELFLLTAALTNGRTTYAVRSAGCYANPPSIGGKSTRRA
jgi:predicted glutamine amidotransferase